MKKHVHYTLTLIVGIALGAVLCGGAYAAGVMAQPTWQPIYIDGNRVEMEAYNINGNNYVRLRDIGKEVGFNVYWQDGVRIDRSSDYTGEPPVTSSSAEINTSSISSMDDVKSKIISLTNNLRKANNLKELQTSDLLMQAAQVRADEIALSGVYSHTRPNGKPFYAVTDCPYAAENIDCVMDLYLTQQNKSLAETAIYDWRVSEGHLKNMLNTQVSAIGVGIAKGADANGMESWYCVQLFLYDGYTITWVDSPAT